MRRRFAPFQRFSGVHPSLTTTEQSWRILNVLDQHGPLFYDAFYDVTTLICPIIPALAQGEGERQ